MSANPAATQEYFAQAVRVVAAMRTEIDRAFTGQLAVVDQVLAAILAGGHVLLEGVPGLGIGMNRSAAPSTPHTSGYGTPRKYNANPATMP